MISTYLDEDDALTAIVSYRDVARREESDARTGNRRYETELRHRRGGVKVRGLNCRRDKRGCQ